MNDSSRPPLPVSTSALLRYSVVAEVEALVLRGWPAGAAVRHVAGADRVDLDGRLVRISVRTLQRWRAAWASGKLAALEPRHAALEPRQRTRTTTSQALSVELVAFLRTEKRCDPRASAPELVRRARERGIVPVDQKIDRTSVWRACRRLGLPTRQRPHKREGDTRRWQYAERMQCVLADGKHFRAGAARNPFDGDGDAQETIFEMSLGNLRAIDRLALAALHLAAKSSHTTVSSGDVIAARKSLWP